MRGIIIVAGGKGLRMGTDIPKQFLTVKGKPILMHTIERFHSFDPCMHIVLVLPKHMQDYWKSLCNEYAFHIPYTLADGGETRYHSVAKGFGKINGALPIQCFYSVGVSVCNDAEYLIVFIFEPTANVKFGALHRSYRFTLKFAYRTFAQMSAFGRFKISVRVSRREFTVIK
jgi:hypothetical protein